MKPTDRDRLRASVPNATLADAMKVAPELRALDPNATLADILADTAPPPPSATTSSPPAVTSSKRATPHAHHVLARRSAPLSAVIAQAQAGALDRDDWQSVWARLVQIASDPTLPAPLLGFVDDEGVKYTGGNGVCFLSREAFRKRWSRTRQRT